jgi:hypothetical protein
VAQDRVANDDTTRFHWLIRYLGVRAQLRSAIELFHSSEIDNGMLTDAAGLAVEAANGKLDEAARKQIAAAWIAEHNGDRKAYIVTTSENRSTIVADLDDDGGAPPGGPPPADAPAPANEPDDGAGGFRWLSGSSVERADVLAPDEAYEVYRAFVATQLNKHTSNDLVLFDLQSDGGGITISVANSVKFVTDSPEANSKTIRSVRLTNDQVSELKSGGSDAIREALKPILPTNRSTALVSYSNPFAARENKYSDVIQSFAFELQRLETDARVYRDPLSAQTMSNVRELSHRLLGKGSDYIAYIDDGSFKITDYNIVQDIHKLLTKAGVQVISGVPKSVHKSAAPKNVIVISAHSDEELRKFVFALGEAGAFRDNYVILNSCETEISQDIADHLTSAYGARAAFVHQGMIPASRVQDLIADLTRRVQKSGHELLVDTLRQIVRGVGLNGVWTVCRMFSPSYRSVDNA